MGVDYPGPVDHHPTVAFDGVIYVFKAPTGEDSYYRFDPQVGQWEPFTPSPHSHHAGSVGIIGDRIHLAGYDWVDLYDPRNDTWESFEGSGDLPTIRNHVSGGALHGRLYLAGGDVGGHSNNTNATEEFDPATGNWTRKAPIPVVRGSAAGVAWMDRLVVLGGQSGDDGTPAYANVDAYDPRTDTWQALPDLPHGVHGTAAVVVDDAIYVMSGAPLQGVDGFTQAFVMRPV